MSAIVQRLFSTDGARNGLVLGGEEFVRPFAFGNNWYHLTIGITCAITPNGVSSISNALLAIGVCNATNRAQTWHSANTLNWVGEYMMAQADTGATLAYTAGSGNPYYNNVATHGAAAVRIGNVSTITTHGSGGGMQVPTTGGAIQRRAFIHLGFVKSGFGGTGTASFTSIQSGSINGSADNLYTTFLNAYFTGSTTDTLSLTVNEASNGPLNALSIWWSSSAFPLEIYDIWCWRDA